jgi:hypothetical protein
MEIFKDIQGFDGVYKISNCGNVMTYSKYSKGGRLLSPEKTRKGYLRVHLKRKHYSIHRLVGIHLIGLPEENMIINHKDGNKENNNILNLEWVTQKENIIHSFENGMSKVAKGSDSKLSKTIFKQNLDGETLEVIKGLKEYCKENNLDRRCVQRAINGEYKTAYGFKWV